MDLEGLCQDGLSLFTSKNISLTTDSYDLFLADVKHYAQLYNQYGVLNSSHLESQKKQKVLRIQNSLLQKARWYDQEIYCTLDVLTAAVSNANNLVEYKQLLLDSVRLERIYTHLDGVEAIHKKNEKIITYCEKKIRDYTEVKSKKKEIKRSIPCQKTKRIPSQRTYVPVVTNSFDVSTILSSVVTVVKLFAYVCGYVALKSLQLISRVSYHVASRVNYQGISRVGYPALKVIAGFVGLYYASVFLHEQFSFSSFESKSLYSHYQSAVLPTAYFQESTKSFNTKKKPFVYSLIKNNVSPYGLKEVSSLELLVSSINRPLHQMFFNKKNKSVNELKTYFASPYAIIPPKRYLSRKEKRALRKLRRQLRKKKRLR